MKNRLFKRVLPSLVMASLLFSSTGVALGASASATPDIKGHWAEDQISAWMDKGFIKGYDNGSFKPENQISRTEFIALVNRSFGFTDEAAISYSDVSAGDWAYPEVAKALKAGYITGYADGTIGANKAISRQEVAVIVDRLLGLSTTEGAAKSFTDSGTIAVWAKGSVDAAVAKGILQGYTEDNSFKPSKSITRAEAVVTLERAVAAKVTVYNSAGMYGPAKGTETINGDVAINVTGVTLQNLEINGKLLFAAGIGSGEAFLNNVTVKGDTTVNGGGVNSLHFKNSKLNKMIIKSSKGTVRVVAEGSTTVTQVNVSSPAVIQEDGATGNGFGDVTLNKDLPDGSDVSLKGTFDNVVVLGDKANVELQEGTAINKFKTDTDTTVTGKGTITTAELGKDSKTTFETKPTTTTVDGTVVPNSPSSSSGGGPTPTPPVTQKGTVIGSVYKDISRNEPIVDVTVSVYSGIQGNGSVVGTVATGSNGMYSLNNVPVGDFYLKFAKAGYTDLTVTPSNHKVNENASTVVSAVYMYSNLVKGFVKNTSLNPISDIELYFYDQSNSDGYKFTTKTEPDGSFYLYNVPAGDSIYVYIGHNHFTYFDVDSPIGLISADGETNINIELIDRRLKTLTLSGITFGEDYKATVPFSVTSTEVSATTMDPKAIIKDGLGTRSLKVGHNSIEVTVAPISGGGYNSTFTIEVYREPDAAQLAAVKVIENYEGEDIDFVDVLNAATGLSTAIGENTWPYIDAVVAAAPGALDTFEEIAELIEFVNHREDKRLSSLELTDVTLDPAFSPDILEYTASVPSNVTSTTILATPMNVNANVHLNYELGIKKLDEGHMNQVQIYVNPESGGYYDIYTVNIFRESGAEQLAAIAKIEAVTDSAESISISDLNKAAGLDTAIAGNLAAYRNAIVTAAAGALDTVEKISNMIESVNDSPL
ncbi:S-layer homology domain-containing protein [Paenibacillus frigoriresistens]|uniref:S-layer homology domain-containing protein n=1 Tax=Paenibacillus alginolyticus TaxID=59839 RepID=UPI0015630574|nr:S-layer homology domain-containing protein [Paenibacillus frigoriresistens]NRF90169.1 S-layer homology domain-containing protein [Paenibacillus frigoriresistens]